MIISHVRIALSQQFFVNDLSNLVKITFGYFDENHLDESKSEGPGLKPMDAWAVKLYLSLTPNLFSEKHNRNRKIIHHKKSYG